MELQGLASVFGVISLPINLLMQKPVMLYFGPETIMPITSVLAAAVGMTLIFWRHITTTVRSGFRRLFIRKQAFPDSNSNLDSGD